MEKRIHLWNKNTNIPKVDRFFEKKLFTFYYAHSNQVFIFENLIYFGIILSIFALSNYV